MSQFLVQNQKPQKNSEIEYLKKYPHPQKNIASANYSTIPITKCLRLKMRPICPAKCLNISADSMQRPSLWLAWVNYRTLAQKRISSWKKGNMKGQPYIMIMNYHKDYNGCCIDFKSQTNKYKISDTQKEMKHKYKNNGYYFLLSNDYDLITKNTHKYMKGIRVQCRYCEKAFYSQETRRTHYKIIHRIEK